MDHAARCELGQASMVNGRGEKGVRETWGLMGDLNGSGNNTGDWSAREWLVSPCHWNDDDEIAINRRKIGYSYR